ncbi:Long-chain-fatty-acid--CoA ligase [Achromobacter xylosoxidans]|uniref:class I adenylate-forming enzyme family protein n=1 Tax=Alcaligenes xylosoxydans xylosoxydans TaxID=85698 RepID=UPI0006C7026E|nr:class I adenylate-forming enzyme family protein [Achromobacter xylosoxidans]CUJ87789.1 Long-chain-fatty-acid--CoA ligase [Achromobacter xylosoxidans]
MSHAEPLTRIHQLLARQAGSQPDAICLYEEGGGILTYAQLWQRARDAADWLAAAGVRPGHRVLMVGENCAAMIATLFGCGIIGAWPVGVNARLSAREIAAISAHAQPEVTLYTSGISAAAAAHAEAAAAQPAEAAAWGAGVHARRADAPTLPETGAPAAEVATVIYTSGTTGAPKGVMVPHRGLLHFAGVSAASRRLTPRDIGYAALPLSHIFGIATVLMATLHAGASLVLRSRFDPEDAFKALAHPGVSILQGVPTMFNRMLAAAPPRAELRAPALRYLYTGGAALDPTLKRDAERYFGIAMHHGYGITEYAGSMFITDIDAPPADCSAGYAVDGVQLRIGRPDADAPRPGEHGDILIRGPGVMLGYYRDPAQTAQALLPGGWLNTGDIGYLDDRGALYIAGRSKDLIIRSGFNVYPIEVEAVINAFPGVRLSAVVGRPTEDHNEEVIAFVEPLAGARLDTHLLMLHLRAQLAPYKRPAQIHCIDTIPTTVSGKILKQPLKERLA